MFPIKTVDFPFLPSGTFDLSRATDSCSCGCGTTGRACGGSGCGSGCCDARDEEEMLWDRDSLVGWEEPVGPSSAQAGDYPCDIPFDAEPCKPECRVWGQNYFDVLDQIDALPHDAPDEAFSELQGWADFYCTQYERCCRGERTFAWPPWSPQGLRAAEEWRQQEARADQAARDAEYKKKYELKCDTTASPFKGLWRGRKAWPDLGVPQGSDPADGLMNMLLNKLVSDLLPEYSKFKCLETCTPATGQTRLKGCRRSLAVPGFGPNCRYYSLFGWLMKAQGESSNEDPRLDQEPGRDQPPAHPSQPIPDPGPESTAAEGGRRRPPRERDFEVTRAERRNAQSEAARYLRFARWYKGTGAINDLFGMGGASIVECVVDLSKVEVRCDCIYESMPPSNEAFGTRLWVGHFQQPIPTPITPSGASATPADAIAAAIGDPRRRHDDLQERSSLRTRDVWDSNLHQA